VSLSGRHISTSVRVEEFDRLGEIGARKGMTRSALLRAALLRLIEEETGHKPPVAAGQAFILKPLFAARASRES
jgi:hypothetical protein